MSDLLITGGKIVNEGRSAEQDVLVRQGRIERIGPSIYPPFPSCKIIDASSKLVIPGLIDDQVHFREPGLTHKACIRTESRAAVAGGITTFLGYSSNMMLVSIFF